MNLAKARIYRKNTLIFSLISCFSMLQMVHAEESVEDFLDLGLEDLLSMEITSVSKKKQRLTEAAAAVFVISQEDIRRSGVTSIPEALRMAPGVQVAQIDSNKWAISTRGFNGQFANKLLVLIDGRSIYTPSFSGVYWDAQDTLMEDIERIEIIRGPGATLWGANAVNGVINIITKYAGDTQGGLITAGGGVHEKAFVGFRYGLDINEDSRGRFYAKAVDRDSFSQDADDSDANDSWESVRTGFRIDGELDEKNSWTLQGDIYEVESDQYINALPTDPLLFDPATLDPLTPPGTVIPTLLSNVKDVTLSTGWNLLARWNFQLSDQSSTALQIYVDQIKREEIYSTQSHNTLDVDFQHNLSIAEGHELIWGLGYRQIEDEFDNTYNVSLNPDSNTTDLLSAFIQDQIEIIPEQFYLTIGSKFEKNDYTGSELQPSIRALWKLDDRSSIWSSVSRAVRTPSRIETTGLIIPFSAVVVTGNPLLPIVPLTSTVNGSEDFTAEDTLAYEIGYRIQPTENLSIDLATFYNQYEHLLSYETLDSTTLVFGNKTSGHASGLELSMNWHPAQWWKIQTSYSTINLSLEVDKNSLDSGSAVNVGEGSSPDHQFSARSTMNLNQNWEFDFWAYYVDEIPAPSVTSFLGGAEIDSYTSLNARLGWRAKENLEFSVAMLNLQGTGHTEFVGEFFNVSTKVERTIYAKLRWDF